MSMLIYGFVELAVLACFTAEDCVDVAACSLSGVDVAVRDGNVEVEMLPGVEVAKSGLISVSGVAVALREGGAMYGVGSGSEMASWPRITMASTRSLEICTLGGGKVASLAFKVLVMNSTVAGFGLAW